MSISKEKWEELKQRMQKIGLEEQDLIEKFTTGSGRGGQKLQKSSSCVYLKHIPTGIEVKCQKERLREKNRFFARRILCEKVEERVLHKKSPLKKKAEKIRKQKKRRLRRQQEKEE